MGYNPNYYIDITFGIYMIRDDIQDMETMYDRATLAASECKKNHRRHIAIYNDEITRHLIHEQCIMNQMAPALEQGQFIVYYQPKYSLKTSRPCGAEALVRWQHPKKGLIMPDEFIPVFEKNGFICKLDFYVWEKACQVIHRWKEEGRELTPVSVNVSRANLYNPNIVELLLNLVKKYDIPTSLLNLELTESAYMDNPQMIKNAINKLRQLGFVILMDDFGSGYSSLGMLNDITVDVLKIDMKFLPTEVNKGRSERILASMIRMAKWLKMPVVMEGVETEEQIFFLKNIGCEYVQGYYFARPMPLIDYESLLYCPSDLSTQSMQEKDGNCLLRLLREVNPKGYQLFRNMTRPMAVCEYNKGKLRLIKVNQAFLKILGYDENSDPYLQYIQDKELQKLTETFENAICFRNYAECEYCRLDQKGNLIRMDLKLQYILPYHNKHILFAICTDITQGRELEIELKKYKLIFKDQQEHFCMLIVDHSGINRLMIREVFQDRYQILEAESGREALQILRERKAKIQIVLLSLVMSRREEDFLISKEQDPEIADIPVLILYKEKGKYFQIRLLYKNQAYEDTVQSLFSEEVLRKLNYILEINRKFKLKETGIDVNRIEPDKDLQNT